MRPYLQEKLFKIGNHRGIRVRVGEKPVVPDTGLALRKCVRYMAQYLLWIEQKPCWGLAPSTLAEGILCDLVVHPHPCMRQLGKGVRTPLLFKTCETLRRWKRHLRCGFFFLPGPPPSPLLLSARAGKAIEQKYGYH